MFNFQKSNYSSLGKLGAIATLSLLTAYGILPHKFAQAQASPRSGCSSYNLEISESFLSRAEGVLETNPSNKQQVYRCGVRVRGIPEPRAYLDSLLHAQENFFAQQNSFSNNLQELQVDLPDVTSYEYFADNRRNTALIYSIPRHRDLRGYVGGIFLLPDRQSVINVSDTNSGVSDTNNSTNRVNPSVSSSANTTTKVTILCVADRPGNTQPAPPVVMDNQVVCGRQTTEVYNYQY
jgi:hypothetical protein